MRYQLFKTKNPATGAKYPKWRFRVFDEDAKYIATRTGYTDKGKTKAKAEDFCRELERDKYYQGMGFAKPSTSPIQSHIQDYLATRASKGGKGGGKWSESHLGATRKALSDWVERLKLRTISDITLNKVELFAAAQGSWSGKTINTRVSYLRAFTRWCHTRDLCPRDPLAGWRKHREINENPRRAFTPDEIRRLFEAAPEEKVAFYRFALYTGARRKEIASIRVGDLDVKKGGVRLDWSAEKNRKGAFLHLPAEYLREIAQASQGRPKTEPLFPSISKSHSARSLQRDCRRAGIEIINERGKLDFHSLRKTFINQAVRIVKNPKLLQDMARHSDPRLTFNLYAESSDDEIRESVEALAASTKYVQAPEVYSQVEKLLGFAQSGVIFESSRPDQLIFPGYSAHG